MESFKLKTTVGTQFLCELDGVKSLEQAVDIAKKMQLLIFNGDPIFWNIHDSKDRTLGTVYSYLGSTKLITQKFIQ